MIKASGKRCKIELTNEIYFLDDTKGGNLAQFDDYYKAKELYNLIEYFMVDKSIYEIINIFNDKKKYNVLVNMQEGNKRVWKKVRPTRGKPYEFNIINAVRYCESQDFCPEYYKIMEV